MLNLSASIEFKRANIADTGEFEGLGSVFGNVDLGGDRVLPGAFKQSLQDHERDGSRPSMLWSHDPKEPVGVWLSVREEPAGLRVHGKLTLDVPRAKAAHALMKDGALGLSIGYVTKVYDYDRDGVRLLKQVDLVETSLVAQPMNRAAKITAVKSALGDIRTFERSLRDVYGLSATEAKSLASGGWRGLARNKSQSTELDELLDAMRGTVDSLTKGI